MGGECRPLSKTVRFNVLKVDKNPKALQASKTPTLCSDFSHAQNGISCCPYAATRNSQVIVVVTDCHILGLLQLKLVLLDQCGINLNLWCLRILTDELEIWLVGETPRQPQERLLEVVVASRAQVVVLQVALSVELDVLSLHLTIFHIYLVANQDDGDVFAHSYDITVPVWHVLVSDTRSNVKHDDCTLTSH